MWAYNETFYQIYPIGFCGAPVHNDGVPAHRILKIGDWAEYLGNLGIGSIILNPTIMDMIQEISAKLTAASAQMKISVKYVRNFIHRMSK